MNAQPQAQPSPKDETKKDGTDFKDRLAKFINPFYVSFVIFWVVCNYDFLLILIGKKAILHDLYSHFGYGCGEKSINLLGYCAKKSSDAYSWYFLIWKIAIPFGLTVAYIRYYYPKWVAPLNLEYENTGKDVLRQMVKAEVDKKIKEETDGWWRERAERTRKTPQNP